MGRTAIPAMSIITNLLERLATPGTIKVGTITAVTIMGMAVTATATPPR